MKHQDILNRVAESLVAHYPQGTSCTCGEVISGPEGWAAHAAKAVDDDGRKWASEQRFVQ